MTRKKAVKPNEHLRHLSSTINGLVIACSCGTFATTHKSDLVLVNKLYLCHLEEMKIRGLLLPLKENQ